MSVTDEPYQIHLPPAQAGGLDQDEEWCEIVADGRRRRIRFHDYAEIYRVPGLYERLFAERLACSSPEVVTGLLADELRRRDADPAELRVLDFGAGNGMVGEALDRLGAGTLVGVDLLEEAAEAAGRDRPGLYDDYHVLDLTELGAADRRTLEEHRLNCLTCVAALGFGDVPPAAFSTAFSLISSPGWVAFNLRDRYADGGDAGGFSALLDDLFDDGALVERSRLSYTHRRSVAGEPLEYVAIVAEKRHDPAA